MNLDELKKSMSTLDDVLAQKNNGPISLNTGTCRSAHSRIAGQYRKNIRICSVLAVVFLALWVRGIGDNSFPVAMKGFLGIYMAVAAGIYTFLYRFLEKIRVATAAPMQIMKQVASLRLYALLAEIFLVIILAVFFTLFLSNLWMVSQYSFWFVAGALLAGLVVAAFLLPGKIRDFRELTAMN